MTRRLFATWTLLLLVAAWASAQFGAGMNLPTVEYNPVLLIDPKVQKELKLSPAVSKNVFGVFMEEAQKLLPAINSGNGATPQQRTKLIFTGVNHMQARLAAMLTPAQRVRLRQLTLQSIGPASVLQPKVAAQLGLTTSQRGRLSQAFTKANAPLAKVMQDHHSAQGWQGQLPQMGQLQASAKAASARALTGILSPTQRAKWSALQGRPFPLSGFLGAGGLMSGLGG